MNLKNLYCVCISGDMGQRLDELLQICTVKITIPGEKVWGTGFFVAPGVILTCAHVIKKLKPDEKAKISWQQNSLNIEASLSKSLFDYDLALLTFESSLAKTDLPCVCFGEEFKPNDAIYIYGYSDKFPQGTSVTGVCEGSAVEHNTSLLVFRAAQIRPGLSGAPLLNLRTKKVCGIAKFTRDRSIDLGGGAIPTSTILEQFQGLKTQQQQFHKQDRRWIDLIESSGEPKISLSMEEKKEIYVVRPETKPFLSLLSNDSEEESSELFLFNLWGIAGVGKKNFLKEIKKTLKNKTNLVEICFSFTSTHEVDTPINLMRAIYKELSTPLNEYTHKNISSFTHKSFISIINEYNRLIRELNSIPVIGCASVGRDQQELVQQIIHRSNNLSKSLIPAKFNQILEETLSLELSIKNNLLMKHPSTQNDLEDQDFLINPLKKITQAFIEDLEVYSKEYPIFIVFEAYDRASLSVSEWLCQYFFNNELIQNFRVKILIVGEKCLKKTEEWKKVHPNSHLYDLHLQPFTKEQTQEFFEAASIISMRSREKIDITYQMTGGLPYYLDWIRRELKSGREPNFAQGNQEIFSLLTRGLNRTSKLLIQVMACCQWFDQGLATYLIKGLVKDSSFQDEISAFEWLKSQSFVELYKDHYRIHSAVRDVFRRAFLQDDEIFFRKTNTLLSIYFEKEVDRLFSKETCDLTKYVDSDWRLSVSDLLYHLAFSDRNDLKENYISYFFVSLHLRHEDVVRRPLVFMSAETPETLLEIHPLITEDNRIFLSRLKLMLDHQGRSGFKLIESTSGYNRKKVKEMIGVLRSNLDSLRGLAKFLVLIYISKNVPKSQCLELLRLAKEEAIEIANSSYPEFSCRIFLWDLGYTYEVLGCYHEALECYEVATKYKQDDYNGWFKQGQLLEHLLFYDKALACYRKALDCQPNDHTALHHYGRTLAKQNRYEEAISAYIEALQFKPNEYELRQDLSNALIKLGRNTESVKLDQLLLKEKPHDYRTWFRQGNAQRCLGQFEESIASYERAIAYRRPEDYLEAWYGLGLSLTNLGRFEEAVNCYDRVIDSEPNFSWALYDRGNALSSLGRKEEALASYERAIEIKRDYIDAWYGRGLVLAGLNRDQEAVDSFSCALQYDPQCPWVWYDQGNALARLGRLRDALVNYERAIEIKRDYIDAWYGRGLILVSLERYKDALESYTQALEFGPDRDWIWIDQGRLLSKLGNFDKAIDNYNRVLDQKPNHTLALCERGYAKAKLEDYGGAIADCEEALKIDNEDAYIWYVNARCYALKGSLESTKKSLQKAIELNPEEYQEKIRKDDIFRFLRT